MSHLSLGLCRYFQ